MIKYIPMGFINHSPNPINQPTSLTTELIHMFNNFADNLLYTWPACGSNLHFSTHALHFLGTSCFHKYG